jgi:hypothetical protein
MVNKCALYCAAADGPRDGLWLSFVVLRTQTEMPFGAEDFSGLIKVRLAGRFFLRESPSRRWTRLNTRSNHCRRSYARARAGLGAEHSRPRLP